MAWGLGLHMIFKRLLSTHQVPKALNHYEILGITTASSHQEIKSAFRKLSKKYHPDMNQSLASEEQKEIKNKYIMIVHSYEVLGNESKRREYDKRILNLHQRATPSHRSSNKVYSPGGINITRNKVYYGAGYQHSDSPYSNIMHNNMGNDVPHFDYDSHLKGNLWFEKRMINKRINQCRQKSTVQQSRQARQAQDEIDKEWFHERFRSKHRSGLEEETNEILNLHRYGHHHFREQTSYDFKMGPVMAVMVGMTVLGMGVYLH